MYTPITSVESTTQVGDRLSIVKNLFTKIDNGNNNHHATSVSELLKEYSRRFDHPLPMKIRVPLGHISLAAEFLESSPADNDVKMCLDIIARNSARLNSLVDEFHNFQQTEEAKSERKYAY